MSFEDPIADRLLSDSPYEQVRARQFSYFVHPIDRKLAWESDLLFALAGILPLLAVFPPRLRQTYFSDVTTASPKLAFVAVVAIVFVAGSGVGHGVVEHQRLRLQPLDEREARDLVAFETLCSLLGFGTGGFATLVTYALVAVGFGGQHTLDAFLALGGGNPFTPSLFGVSLGHVAVLALVSGVSLQLLSIHCRRRVALVGEE